MKGRKNYFFYSNNAEINLSFYPTTLFIFSVTNQDGRCNSLIQKQEFVAGRYKLHFDTDRYFELERKETLYPFVEVGKIGADC